MTLAEYFLLVGDKGLADLAARADTRVSYLRQLMYRPADKEPSLTMAVRLVEASGGRLTFGGLQRAAAPDHRSIRRVTSRREVRNVDSEAAVAAAG